MGMVVVKVVVSGSILLVDIIICLALSQRRRQDIAIGLGVGRGRVWDCVGGVEVDRRPYARLAVLHGVLQPSTCMPT